MTDTMRFPMKASATKAPDIKQKLETQQRGGIQLQQRNNRLGLGGRNSRFKRLLTQMECWRLEKLPCWPG